MFYQTPRTIWRQLTIWRPVYGDLYIWKLFSHHNDVIMSSMTSQITGVSIVNSAVCSGAYQRKHQSSAWLVFVRGIHRWPMNSPHKGPVTRKMFPFDDVITILKQETPAWFTKCEYLTINSLWLSDAIWQHSAELAFWDDVYRKVLTQGMITFASQIQETNKICW